MKHDLTIIIPTYNVAPFVGQCLDSIIKQTDFNQFEVLVINDGSTDNTKSIVEKYTARYENIHLYNTKNNGVSTARNIGIRAAMGQYISFVDPDDQVGIINNNYIAESCEPIENMVLNRDYINPADRAPFGYDPDYFVRMLDAAQTANADIAMGGKVTTYENQSKIQSCTYYNPCVYDKSPASMDARLRMAYRRESANFAVYRRDLINKHALRFAPQMTLNEDILFCMSAVLHANAVVCVPNSLYWYRRRKKSLSSYTSDLEYKEKYTTAILQCMSVFLNELNQLPGYAASYTYWTKYFSNLRCFSDDYWENNFPSSACVTCHQKSCHECEHHCANRKTIQKNLEFFAPFNDRQH